MYIYSNAAQNGIIWISASHLVCLYTLVFCEIWGRRMIV
jgi:hypothetical protein